MKPIPLYDETAQVACTITDEEIPDRVAQLERMRDNLETVERTENGLLLHFPVRADIEDDLRRFAVDEKRCCQFWGFDVVTDGGLALRWDGPPATDALLDRFESFFAGDGSSPLDLAGLL